MSTELIPPAEVIDFGILPPVPSLLAGGVYQQPERAEAFARACGFAPPPGLRDPSAHSMLDDMNRANVVQAVIRGRRQSNPISGTVIPGPFLPSAIPDSEISALVQEHPGRFLAYGGVGSDDLAEPQAMLDRLRPHDEFRGVTIAPGYFDNPIYIDDPSLFAFYDLCSAQGVPVMINFGGNSGPDISFTDPLSLDHVAATFPKLTIVAHHGGWPWVSEVLHVAFRRANVWLAPDMHIFGMPGWRDYVDAGNGFLKDRLLYASYFPFLPIVESAARFATMFSLDVVHKLMFQNARRLLDLGH